MAFVAVLGPTKADAERWIVIMMQTEFSVGGRKFVLDKKKAEAAFSGKSDFGERDDDLQSSPAEIYLGLRPLSQDEGKSLGA